MRGIGRIVRLVFIVMVWLTLLLTYPLLTLLVSFSVFALLAVLRQLNLYKMVMMLKQYARRVSRLRSEIRLRLHMGFRDHGVTLDDKSEHRRRTTGCL